MAETKQDQKKMLPGQKPGESLDDYLNRTWNDPAIVAEFEGDFDTYRAWAKAESQALIKLLGKEKDEK